VSSHQGKEKGGKGRETHKFNIKNTKNTNNVNNKRKKQNIQNPIYFPGAGCWGAGTLPADARQVPGGPGLASAVDRNWTEECTDWNLDQDLRQDKEQGPLQKLVVDKESKILMTLSCKPSMTCTTMKYLVG